MGEICAYHVLSLWGLEWGEGVDVEWGNDVGVMGDGVMVVKRG